MHKINVLIDNKRYWIKEFPSLENFTRIQMKKFFSDQINLNVVNKLISILDVRNIVQNRTKILGSKITRIFPRIITFGSHIFKKKIKLIYKAIRVDFWY